MSSPVVCANGVARTYGRGAAAVVAVHGASCALGPGEQVVLSGPSGSGKTTLLHLLAGLDEPTTGTVTWPAIGTRVDLRPGPVGIVFQAPSLLPPLDVTENVALPLLLQGMSRRSARKSALRALDRLALGELADRLPEELSGGQAQRVATARVLAGRPQLILADEPTGQLDHANAHLVIDALIETASHVGSALIVNTHDETIAARFERRWAMASGRLVSEQVPC
jgi:ABC-type lipoprotein export system ATPase subunit